MRGSDRGEKGAMYARPLQRELLHLVFAVWKSGRPFDPNHYSWDRLSRTTATLRPQEPKQKVPQATRRSKPPIGKWSRGKSQRRPRYNSRQRAGATATPGHPLCVPPPTNHDGTNLARTRLAVAAQGNAASVTRSVPDSRWKRLPTSLLLGSPVKTDLPLLPRRVSGRRKLARTFGPPSVVYRFMKRHSI